MKVSLIIAVYKDVEALHLIFKSLKNQTYENFEVVVAEDGESEVMLEAIAFAKNKYSFEIIHVRQEDNGVRKSCSQNNGIKASSGEYLIFIDGDCLLYSTFIRKSCSTCREKKYSNWTTSKCWSTVFDATKK
ncbi:MAG: glycosyltransferase [Sulfurimonas sp.]|nr:glycosyltransferase [Sulfurimonas sp.]